MGPSFLRPNCVSPTLTSQSQSSGFRPGARRLILFVRHPIPGKVKTRMIPALGVEGAVGLHRRLVLRALRTSLACCSSDTIDLEIRYCGGDSGAMEHWLGGGWHFRRQSEGDLGRRLADAFETSFREASCATVLIGGDCPALTDHTLATAFDQLRSHPVVLGPATDGGYYLVGLTRPVPELFQGVCWGTGSVLAESLRILRRVGITPRLLEVLDDLDRPGDLPAWQRLVEQGESDLGKVSVIMPARNEQLHIREAITSVQHGHPHEIIVVDGGSTDQTREVAQAAGAKVLSEAAGRARQMNAGAARAEGNVLLFLHADTQLPYDWPGHVRVTLDQAGVVAGAFRFRIAEPFRGRWLVECITNLRSRWLQNPYGDQGLFLRRALFEEMGGFAHLPIMEDYELNCRLRQRGRVVTAAGAARTSGRRWCALGVLRTTIINQLIIAGYRLGLSPQRLARFYRGNACG
jgi:uncharacterized protein